MIGNKKGLLLGALLVVGTAQTSSAELVAASPNTVDAGITGVGEPVFLVPEWFRDAIGLQLQYCPAGSTFCLAPLAGEGFWAGADVIGLPMTSGGAVSMILAQEAANIPPPGIFSRLRVDFDGLGAVSGDYRITHPYGVDVVLGVDVAADPTPRLVDRDLGPLAGDIGPFLYADTGVPFLDPGNPVGDNFHIGQAGTVRTVFGSPLGQNFFRVERKAVGAPDTAYTVVAETNLFDVFGKVFTNAGALAATPPVLVADVNDPVTAKPLAMLAGSFKDFDVLANDQTANNVQVEAGLAVAINPTTLGAFAVAPAGAAGTAVAMRDTASNKVRMRFTPNPAFAGLATVNYNAATFTGALAAAPGTSATILVEDLQVPTAEFLPKLMKWRIEGTSNTGGAGVIPNTVEIRLGSAVDANGLPTGPVLGTAPVDALTGKWVFDGKSTVTPGATPRTISVVSGNSVARNGVPCNVR